MSNLREEIVNQVRRMDQDHLQQVAQYLSFLRFQRRRTKDDTIDEETFAALCAEFAEEDRSMAEEGIAEFRSMLQKEDELCQ